MSKNLISASSISKAEAIQIISLAESLKARQAEPNLRSLLSAKTVANVFYEDSTRTRISFELAAKRLGADVVNFSTKGSSVSKGETFSDTLSTLDAMAVDAFVLRSPESGAASELLASGLTKAAVINAGDGTNEHPTQALLDALTIRERFSLSGSHDLTGISVLITGDIKHSRVARSNCFLLSTLGAHVTLCAPADFLPDSGFGEDSRLISDFDEALAAKPNVVMMLRVQAERMDKDLMPSAADYIAGYQLNAQRDSTLSAQSIVMHPGPMNREFEITSAVADGQRSAIRQQVTNGVFARMAVLYSTITDRLSIDV
jgi:aspartate carbamoyltransferase catalytic subunit